MPDNWQVYTDPVYAASSPDQGSVPPGLLQMAQGIAPQMAGGNNMGFGSAQAAEPYYPANWREQSNTYFTWEDRNREFQDAENRSYASGGADQAAAQFLAKTPRPKLGFLEGANLPSTNNWQVLPPAYRKPGFAMVNGRIIDTAMANPKTYLESLGIGQDDPGHYKMSEGVGIGYPVSLNDLSIGGQKGIWPGDVRGRESFINPSYPTT